MGNLIAKNPENRPVEKMQNESNPTTPRPFSSIADEELATYTGVFIPGGHAPLTDLGDNAHLGRMPLHFHNCGYRHSHTLPWSIRSSLSCSDAEESLIERMKDGEVPRKVESALANEGAEIISTVGKKLGSITVDRELISGAIPMAASDIGAELVRKLQHASQEVLEFEISAVS